MSEGDRKASLRAAGIVRAMLPSITPGTVSEEVLDAAVAMLTETGTPSPKAGKGAASCPEARPFPRTASCPEGRR